MLTFTQNSDSTLLLDWQGEETVVIDSTLHAVIYRHVGPEMLEQAVGIKVRLFLDRQLPLSTLRDLMLECRKLDMAMFWLITEDSLPIAVVMPPLKEDVYIDTSVELPVRLPYPPVLPIPTAAQDSNIHVVISPDTIVQTDFSNNPIADRKAYLRSHPRAITGYEFTDNCTYQDYIDAQIFLMRPTYELREEASADTTLTERDIKKMYPLRCADLEYFHLQR